MAGSSCDQQTGDSAGDHVPGRRIPDLMRRVERVVGHCQPCLERHLRQRMPLPLEFVRAIEHYSDGRIGWFICPHGNGWHLRFPYDEESER